MAILAPAPRDYTSAPHLRKRPDHSMHGTGLPGGIANVLCGEVTG